MASHVKMNKQRTWCYRRRGEEVHSENLPVRQFVSHKEFSMMTFLGVEIYYYTKTVTKEEPRELGTRAILMNKNLGIHVIRL